MSRKKHIIYLGSVGFPYGMAEIQKIILISKSLILKGNHVTVISNKGVHNSKDHPEFKAFGEYQNIQYEYTSGEVFRQDNFIKRNVLKAKGFINEFRSIRKKKKNNKLDFAIISTHNFYLFSYYCAVSKISGFKTILNYVEFYSGVKKKPSQFRKHINDYLFDKFAPKMVDSIFPISEFLINHIQDIAPQKKYLKIPVLTDFDKYIDIKIQESNPYILFCGAAGYMEIIQFIVDSYNKIADKSVYLYMVINGNHEDKLKVIDYFSKTKKANLIKMFSKLSEKELYTYYKNAFALLIPLRSTFQDIARFPHKTGEYMASGNPVISTNFGEMKYYFKNNENIFLADDYDIDLYAEKIMHVIENPHLAEKIGLEGKKLAEQLFDYKFKATEIDTFLEEQIIK